MVEVVRGDAADGEHGRLLLAVHRAGSAWRTGSARPRPKPPMFVGEQLRIVLPRTPGLRLEPVAPLEHKNNTRGSPASRRRTTSFHTHSEPRAHGIEWRPAAGRHSACVAVTPRKAPRKVGPCHDARSYASSSAARRSAMGEEESAIVDARLNSTILIQLRTPTLLPPPALLSLPLPRPVPPAMPAPCLPGPSRPPCLPCLPGPPRPPCLPCLPRPPWCGYHLAPSAATRRIKLVRSVWQ